MIHLMMVLSFLVVKRFSAFNPLEIRFPIPYSILLRRVSSFTHMNHLVLHAATSKLESWLFIAEIPERFKMYQKNLHSLENSEQL
jgi:hypothetical protein